MKYLKLNLSILAYTLLFSFSSYCIEETSVTSKITKVTVYQQGAQIERKASYSIRKGINEITLEGISPNIDPNSIQVNASGNIILLDSKYSIEYPKPEVNENHDKAIPKKTQYEITLLNDSIFNTTYKLLELQYKIEILNNEKRIIENNGTIKGTGKVNDSIPLLRDALEFYHIKMNKINHELLILTKKQALVTRVKNRMNTRLSDLNNYNANNNFINKPNKAPIYKIKITVSAKEAASGRVYVSYLAKDAGWTPSYDLRSKASDNTVNLTYKAKVFQNTGVKWDNVRLNLSTNNPYANKTKPELYPWYLNYSNNYYNTKSSSGITNISYKKKELAPQRASKLDKEMVIEDVSEEKTAMSSEQFTQIIKQLISIEYAIDLPYTIESTNEKYMVLIDSKTLNTKYKYYVVPKMDLSCYLVAQITDLGDLNLIPGNATIFHDGAYLGVTYLNPSIMTDTMNLSLGKDPKLQVKRTLLKNESKEKVIGDKIVKTFAYHIEIKNHKSISTKITIQDQIPVTQNTEIEIELIDGNKGKVNEITGIIEWDIKLKSKETKTIDLVYNITYNKTKNVNVASLK
jgi:uncharacterized protein (TIGR02231 family)